MFPIRSDIITRRAPLALYLLICLNFAVFIKELSLGPGEIEDFIEAFGMIPARDFVARPSVWLPFFTSMFLHAGGLHIFLNIWALWIFGAAVEAVLGPARFLAFYVATGVGATYAHAALNPDSSMPVVGASGAIAGVMAGYLLLFPRSRLRMMTLLIFFPIVFDLPAVVFLVLWFAGQLLNAVYSGGPAAGEAGDIAFAAHLGGFIFGLVLLPIFRRR